MSHWLRFLMQKLRFWQPPSAGPEQDPYAGVRVPTGGGPSRRSSAIAVAEPEPDRAVEAIARRSS
jgi:hypothetical protein